MPVDRTLSSPRAAGSREPAARMWALLVTLLVSACGGSPSSGLGTPPPGPTGTVSGTATVDSGSASAASASTTNTPHLPVARPHRADRRLPDPDRVVVGLRSPAAADRVSAASIPGLRLLRTSPARSFAVFRLQPGQDSEQAIARLRALPDVAWVARDGYVRRHADPNDALYGQQWHYGAIGLPGAWAVTTGSPVVVAVVDTGVRPDHPDLQGVFVRGYDFVDGDDDPTDPGCASDPQDWSHGTHVAGTVAALTGNTEGVAGVTWGGASAVRIMPLRVLGESGGECGVGYLSDVASAIEYAAQNGARIVNLSLGGPDHPVLQAAVQFAHSRGVVLVASAGNRPADGVQYPAAYPEVIAVAATDCRGQRAPYSAYGSQVFIAAPGGGAANPSPCGTVLDYVLSTSHNLQLGNTYVWMAGTSMAAPHVSGVAALLFGRGFTTPDAVRDRLRSTAVDIPPTGRDDYTGWGLVDAAAAVGADSPVTAMVAFACSVSGSTVRALSPTARVQSSGQFSIPQVPEGTVDVCAWQDANGNRGLDPGDLWGRTGPVTVHADSVTSGVAVTVRVYSGQPAAVQAQTGR